MRAPRFLAWERLRDGGARGGRGNSEVNSRHRVFRREAKPAMLLSGLFDDCQFSLIADMNRKEKTQIQTALGGRHD